MMDIDFLPLHLIILGGNYVGLEFAQIYCRFGSEVTVIEFAPRLIPREDEDVSKAVLDILKDEGVNVRVDSKVVGLQREGNAIVVKVELARKMSPTAGSPQHGDEFPSQIVGTHLLVAIDRRPNTNDLGRDKAGIATDARGYIQVDDQFRRSVVLA